MNNWINVKDRLPDNHETILTAAYSHEREIYSVSPASYWDNKFYDCCGDEKLVDGCYWEITHWMPLPDAPKENK